MNRAPIQTERQSAMLTIDWTQYDHLPPRKQYDAVGKLIDQAKAAVAAKRAEIAANLSADVGAQAAAETLGISGTRVYQLAARHRAAATQTTAEYAYWAQINDGSERRYLGYIREVIEAGGGDPDRYDVDSIGDAYRDAIQAELPDGVVFAREEFIGPYPAPEGAREEIRAAVARVDLWEIIARHDLDETESA
ncbi:hypothetical protein [Streptomyces sp.]|uniref:hypothetical protein n=1 Tax=Streptomyces sp. TaxID=1931 RepID=UPI002F3FD223